MFLQKDCLIFSFGFSRPFISKDLFGYEPWHISYTKSAQTIIDNFDIDCAIAYLESFDEPWIEYAIEYVRAHKDRIFGDIYGR